MFAQILVILWLFQVVICDNSSKDYFMSCSGVYGSFEYQRSAPYFSIELTKRAMESEAEFKALMFHYADILNYDGIPSISQFKHGVNFDFCSDADTCDKGPWLIEDKKTPLDEVVNSYLRDKLTYPIKNEGMYCVYVLLDRYVEQPEIDSYFNVHFQQPYGFLSLEQKRLLDFHKHFEIPVMMIILFIYLVRLVYIKRYHREIPTVEASVVSLQTYSLENLANTIIEPLKFSTQNGVTLIQRVLKFLMILEFIKSVCTFIYFDLANGHQSPFVMVFIIFDVIASSIQTLLVFYLACGWGTLYKDSRLNDFPERLVKMGAFGVVIQGLVRISLTVSSLNSVDSGATPMFGRILKTASSIVNFTIMALIYLNLRSTNKQISQYMDKGLAKRFTLSYRIAIFMPIILVIVSIVILILHMSKSKGLKEYKTKKKLDVYIQETSWKDNTTTNLIMIPLLSTPLTYAMLAYLWDNVNPDEFVGVDVTEEDIPAAGRITLNG